MTIRITSGRIWDGDAFREGDVLIRDGKIAAIGANIAGEADFVYDAAGGIVSAGLVDAHVHYAGISDDAYGIDSSLCTIPYGVTAAADAGCIQGDPARLAAIPTRSRVYSFIGFRDNHIVADNALRMLKVYGDAVIGFKVSYDSGGRQVRDIIPLREAAELAHSYGMPLVVHSTGTPVPMAELLSVLRSGDILTHAYHGGIHTAAEDDFASIKEARDRGVIIDAGMAGYVHTDFDVLRAAIAAGAEPQVISTDVTKLSLGQRGGNYGMTLCMSIAREAGMTEEAILRAVTSAPARAMGQTWGRLYVGGAADICVLAYTHAPFAMTDRAGNSMAAELGYQNQLTILGGQLLYRR